MFIVHTEFKLTVGEAHATLRPILHAAICFGNLVLDTAKKFTKYSFKFLKLGRQLRGIYGGY